MKDHRRGSPVVFLIPGDLDSPTGGYGYARRVIEASMTLGVSLQAVMLPGEYPRPDPAARIAARQTLAHLQDRQTVLIDGLALGVLDGELALHTRRLDLVALVHHPLFRETGLDPQQQAQLFHSERAALHLCNRILTTSERTAADVCAVFGFPADRVFVAQPGTDRRPFARGSKGSQTQLLCVGSVVPRKGHAVLIEALASIASLPWRLDCVGALDRDRGFGQAMQRLCQARALRERVRWLGALSTEALADAWDKADVFVLCSEHEGYGMAYAEAISAGLPIVGTTAAAVPELVDAQALLVAPADRQGVADALASLMVDGDKRATMAAAARRVATALPQWSDTAATIIRVLACPVP